MRFPCPARLAGALIALAACDRIRALPGVEPKSRAATSTEPAISLGPWLMEPGPSEMTVAWVTSAASPGRVWYGTTDADRLAQEATAPSVDHRVVLGGLKPGTRYRYRVEGAAPAYGTFTTAPAAVHGASPDSPFEVLVYGDNRTNSGDHALVARAAAAEQTQLALHTGDMVVNANDDRLWKTWFAEERDLLSTTPLVPTVGNHEITDKGTAYTRWFRRRDLPAYRSLDYGPLHLVVLDSFEVSAGATPRAGGISDVQRAWLEEDLRAAGKDRHVWVLVHQGPAAHPLHMRPGHGGSEAVRQALIAAARIHPIEAVFAGHEHFYERGDLDGLRYFVFGGGGAPLEDPAPASGGVQVAQKALSYAVVQVCGCHVAGKVKDIAGHVIDTFRLADCEVPCGPFAAGTALTAAATPGVPGASGAAGATAAPGATAPAAVQTALPEPRTLPAAGSGSAEAGAADAGSERTGHHRRRRRRRSRKHDAAPASDAPDAGAEDQ